MKIHLIQKNDPGLPRITPIAPGSQTYRSGNWSISEVSASELIGGKIFFHRKQAEPSFFGGVIRAFEMIHGGDYDGRVIFTFESDLSYKGIRTPKAGWSQELKIIRCHRESN